MFSFDIGFVIGFFVGLTMAYILLKVAERCLYAKLYNVLYHPIKYFKWRKRANRMWKKDTGEDVVSFDWCVKNKNFIYEAELERRKERRRGKNQQ